MDGETKLDSSDTGDGHLSYTSSPSRTLDDGDASSSCFDLSTFTKEVEDWMKSLDEGDDNTTFVLPVVTNESVDDSVPGSPILEQLPSDIRYSVSMTDEKISTVSSYPPEPDPVRSPPFQAFSNSSMHSTPPITPARARELGTMPSLSPHTTQRDNNNKRDDLSVWETLIESMRQTMRLQDEQIRALRKENTELRDQLSRRPRRESSKMSGLGDSSSIGSRTKNSRDEFYQVGVRNRFPTHSYQYSPGTKFVAELSQLMELEVGHYSALSSIMDRRLTTSKNCDPTIREDFNN